MSCPAGQALHIARLRRLGWPELLGAIVTVGHCIRFRAALGHKAIDDSRCTICAINKYWAER